MSTRIADVQILIKFAKVSVPAIYSSQCRPKRCQTPSIIAGRSNLDHNSQPLDIQDQSSLRDRSSFGKMITCGRKPHAESHKHHL